MISATFCFSEGCAFLFCADDLTVLIWYSSWGTYDSGDVLYRRSESLFPCSPVDIERQIGGRVAGQLLRLFYSAVRVEMERIRTAAVGQLHGTVRSVNLDHAEADEGASVERAVEGSVN